MHHPGPSFSRKELGHTSIRSNFVSSTKKVVRSPLTLRYILFEVLVLPKSLANVLHFVVYSTRSRFQCTKKKTENSRIPWKPWRTTSGAAGNGLSRCWKLLILSIASKQKSTAEFRCLVPSVLVAGRVCSWCSLTARLRSRYYKHLRLAFRLPARQKHRQTISTVTRNNV